MTTYNESTELVRRTILAFKNLEYPVEALSIWVCDDGRRLEMKRLAESLSVGYITRSNNDHAKAGNLNNALALTKEELIVTIDADMIPKPNFLKIL
ncbi:glycosyltransferase [Bacillus mesophilus]|uniref:glycosyltransferase n=1 Tax=Bacillus mesophilus TaxID=1808955 RepID=UPI003B84610C